MTICRGVINSGLSILALSLFLMRPLLPQALPGRDVVERFCKLDEQGKQLSPDGWREIAAQFTSPGPRRVTKMTIIKDFVVSDPAIQGGKTLIYVEYRELGSIDLATMRFTPHPPLDIRSFFYLVSLPDRAGTWQIEGRVPQPQVGIDAASRHLAELGTKTNDANLRRRANEIRTALSHLR